MRYNLYKKRKRIPWHFSHFEQSETGLPVDIWIVSWIYKHQKLGPWIQVSNTIKENYNEKYDICIVSIEDVPKVLFGELNDIFYIKVKEFIHKNKEILLDHWYLKNDTGYLLDNLRKV